MSIKPCSFHKRQSASSLIEVVVTLGVMGLIAGAFGAFLYSAGVNLMNIFTYASMDTANQHAINMMTREIRLADRVTGVSTGSLTVAYTNGVSITYAHFPRQRTVVRSSGGKTTTLLRDCDAVKFTLGKQSTNGFEVFVPVSNVSEAKVVDFSWRCSKAIARTVASDEMTSAKIVIRN
jgi:hypothetical protein